MIISLLIQKRKTKRKEKIRLRKNQNLLNKKRIKIKKSSQPLMNCLERLLTVKKFKILTPNYLMVKPKLIQDLKLRIRAVAWLANKKIH